MSQVDQLWDRANAYKVSVALFALSETGVLRALAEAPKSAAELAEGCGLITDALEPLLELMVTSGVLERAALAYALPRAQARVLPFVELEAQLCAARIHPRALVGALRGQPLGDPMDLERSAPLWPVFLRAMAVGAASLAPHLARAVRAVPGTQLVDLGGADGSLALALSRMLPELRVTIVDRQAVATAFAERCREAGALEGFAFLAADLRCPSTWVSTLDSADVIIAANVLHLLTPDQRRGLLAAVLQHGKPGSQLVVYEQFVSRERADAASCLVVDWLLCGTPFGETEVEFGAALEQAGFRGVAHRRAPGLPGALVVAVLPERVGASRSARVDSPAAGVLP